MMINRKFILLTIFTVSILILSCVKEKPANASQLNFAGATESVSIFGKNVISTPLYERDLAISPDGNWIIYTLSTYDHMMRGLVAVQKINSKWQSPKLLPFSGQHSDIEPFFHPNGKTLFFASNRPIPTDTTRRDYNLWQVELIENNWGTPKPLSDNVNTAANEFFPSVAANGNLYFTASYQGGIGREDIWMSKFKNGTYLTPTVMDTAINTKRDEFNAAISPDENTLFFSSFGRPDGFGGGDLYISQKDENGNWQKAVHLSEPLNSAKLDFSPFVDYKNGIFYFTSTRRAEIPRQLYSLTELQKLSKQVENGTGNIYYISLSAITAYKK